MKYLRLLLVLIVVLFNFDNDLSAQRKRTPSKSTPKKQQKKEELSEDKFVYDIRLGNVGINQGFSLSAKPGFGYKLLPFLNAGVGSRLYFDYINYIGAPDVTYFSYGGFAYVRGVIANRFYLQAEYGATRFDFQQQTVAYPNIGLGYISPTGSKWGYGIEINLPFSDRARDYGPPLEYWINFTYNLSND